MTDYDTTYLSANGGSGSVRLEFVDPPALNGDAVEWTFRAVGGTAPAGTVAAQIVVLSDNHAILGGGTNSLGSDLGPHDTGGSRVRPLQYTSEDGDYYLSITIGDDVRYVSYRVRQRTISAA